MRALPALPRNGAGGTRFRLRAAAPGAARGAPAGGHEAFRAPNALPAAP